MKIKLKIKNKNVELSTQEAEELFDQLSEIFGPKFLEQPYIPQFLGDTSSTIPYPNYKPAGTCDDNNKYV